MSWAEIINAAVALSLVPMAMAAASDAISGWLEVKGKRVTLGHAFAVMAEDFAEKGKERVEVLLSDKPVPEELRKASDAWVSWASEQSRAGQLHGVILYLDPETKAWGSGQFLSPRGLQFYSESVSSPELASLVFTPAPAGSGEIAGKVTMKKARGGIQESDGSWQVGAEFRCPILARPAVTGSLTGAAARGSAPAKAVVVYLEACKKKDFDGIKKAMAASMHPMLDSMASQGKDQLLAMIAGEAEETLGMTLSTVTIRGDAAEIEFTDPKNPNGSQTLTAVLENGVWKLGQ